MRYLITHDPRCECADPTPYRTDDPHAVALFFWGRDVLDHVVYEGECPYRFTLGDLDSIAAVLRLYPVALVRQCLPLTIPVKALWEHGVETSLRRGAATFCEIGTRTGAARP